MARGGHSALIREDVEVASSYRRIKKDASAKAPYDALGQSRPCLPNNEFLSLKQAMSGFARRAAGL
jgi:hypothetical protein